MLLTDRIACHTLTREEVCLKIKNSSLELVIKACTLRSLAGGVGFPSLHWFGMVNGHDILAINHFGPSLEHFFNQMGRQFSSEYLYLLADQLLSRLEFAHSRFIVHGDLNPYSVTISYFPWQFQQIVLSCPTSAARPGYSAHDDLLALGDLIHYFSSGTVSWVEFQRDQYNGKFTKKPAFFDRYTDAVFSADPPDYSALRKIFCDAHQYMDFSIPISSSGKVLELESEMSAILRSSTKQLFEVLGSKISEVGRKTGDPTAAWSQHRGVNLLQALPNILQIYTELMFRYCSPHSKECSLFRPYRLPNHLWLDLLWYVGNARSAPAPFQKAVVGTIYRYITILLEVIPFEKIYWVGYLAVLAHLSKEMEVGFQRRIWEQTRLYWENQVKQVKAEGITNMADSHLI